MAKKWFSIAAFLLIAFSVHAANPRVQFQTSLGDIELELLPNAAPQTVENFLGYVKEGFYDGTQFHRVIKGFMIQGGGFTADLKQKATKAPIKNEAEQASKAGLKNEPGTIAMARTAIPDSATAQFFINVAPNTALDFKSPDPGGIGYVVFGKVVKGMDVVEKIATTPVESRPPHQHIPKETVLIKKASVVTPAS